MSGGAHYHDWTSELELAVVSALGLVTGRWWREMKPVKEEDILVMGLGLGLITQNLVCRIFLLIYKKPKSINNF